MATNAGIGYGTTYEIWDPDISTPALVTLGEVKNVDLGSDETDLIDVTHNASPDRRREFIAGLIDGGEASVELNFVPNSTTDALLRARQTAGDTQQHKVTFPDGSSVTFDAIVRSVGRAVPVDDVMSQTFTAKKTGAEVWAEAV